jgi:hypothetical protein
MSFESEHLHGWLNRPDEVLTQCATMPIPIFRDGSPKGNEPVLLYDIYREIAGGDDLGVQQIGDCVSWGWKHLVDYTQAVEIYREIKDLSAKQGLNGDDLREATQAKLYTFEMSCSEAIYGLSRVEIGGQRGSRSDGSVGAWAAKAVTKYGTISYKELIRQGLDGTYSGSRAKQWGAQGLPDNLEPTAAKHIIATTSLVTNFADAAHLIENGYGIAVCSNVGFENAGRGSQTLRDAQGFASPRGRWDHCMFFNAVRYDRPGLCLVNQWPEAAFAGPLGLNQPKNSFWVDERVVNTMLGQGDSFTASSFAGYPLRPLTFRF